jgi:hypothetical protein
MSRNMTRKRDVCRRLVIFLIWIEHNCFVVNVYIPMVIVYFRHDFITKGNNIKYMVRNGTDIF